MKLMSFTRLSEVKTEQDSRHKCFSDPVFADCEIIACVNNIILVFTNDDAGISQCLGGGGGGGGA